MRRATITIDDDLEAMLDSYLRRQEVSPALTSVVQAALREYLLHRGFASEPKRLRITPAKRGSESRDASVHHDRYLAGK